MSRPLVIAAPGSEAHAAALCERLGAEPAALAIRRFPDGEYYVRIDSEVAGRHAIVVGSFDQPSEKFLLLSFLAATARDLGAARVGLVAPYLAFMRQDERFHPGEGVTARYFAKLLGASFDWLVAVDPHLHRLDSLDRVYAIPSTVARAAPAIARWIAAHVERPILIGPDAESEQWVRDVAERCGAQSVILTKIRRGDRDVSVSSPTVVWDGRTPVVVDDIISTGRTMLEAVKQLAAAGAPPPVCVGIHAVFADDAMTALTAAGARQVVTCDTLSHPSNAIAVADAIADATWPHLRSA